MMTVGLDFGTHNTKVCIEEVKQTRTYKTQTYTFFKHKSEFMIKSIIQRNADNTLNYGFIKPNTSKLRLYVDNSIISKTKYPQKQQCQVLSIPQKPKILSEKAPEGGLSAIKQTIEFRQNQIKAKQQYEAELVEYNKNASNIDNILKDIEQTYRQELKTWFYIQNKSILKKIEEPLVYKNFKYNTFCNKDSKEENGVSSELLSIWFISYILFLLQQDYGNDFTINMGVPADKRDFAHKREKAVSILLSAYNLVENVFANDLESFLNSTITELTNKTKRILYSKEKKDEFVINIFPEAYANLKSLTAKRALDSGLSLLIDIGGGTTDITFFSVGTGRKDNELSMYDYLSMPYGLNYIDNGNNTKQYNSKLNELCNKLIQTQQSKFSRKTGRKGSDLFNSKDLRTVVYSGGGSRRKDLIKPIPPYFVADPIIVSDRFWKGMRIKDIDELKDLSPILANSIGLLQEKNDDDINLSSIENEYKESKETNETGYGYSGLYDI